MRDKKKIVNLVVDQIRSQIIIGTESNLDSIDNPLNEYALGYIFGFSCGSFENSEIRNYLEKMSILTQVYSKLFGTYGEHFLKESLSLQGNPDFQKGGNCGWEEMKRILFREERAMGLARFLKEGKATFALSTRKPVFLNNAALSVA